MAGLKTLGASLLILSMLILFAAHGHAHEDHAAVEAKDGSSKSSVGEHVKYGRMSYEDHEGSNSDDQHHICTCTCYPGGDAPKTPRSAPKPPTSQNSPTERKRSPPPAPYYSPSPVYSNPSPPPRSTQSPVTFISPPPPAPYSYAPATDEPSPVVTAPETFQPSPPIY
ncbi:hypothetical protein KC19_7G157700 [Ceratodon purpureus]|uniref:Uncharacterized protein n=1 Tax=Ceratodon purpureus TaxID=3225 RepID=A0A8T0HBI2_CERPU|nr:hypothetical protein KC19_7G157700 [Ceratodon purpureus]